MIFGLLKKLFSVVLLSLMFAANAYAAAYVKYDGIDGEAKDTSHDKWIDVLSIDYSAGKLFVTKRNGEKVWLKQTGSYKTNDGRVFIVKNGKVIKQTRGKARLPAVQRPADKPKANKDMVVKGKKILQN